MADQRGGGAMTQPQHQESPVDMMKGIVKLEKGPSAAQVLAVAALVPVGGILLALSGITLTGTVIALAMSTPLFVLFSPVLVPAAFVIGLAVAGFLASGAFGVTAMSALAWIINSLRGARGGRMQDPLELAKRRMGEAAGQVGQKAKDVGQKIEGKAQEAAGRT